MHKFKLTNKEIKKLRLEHKQTKDKKYSYRIKAIILLAQGWTYVDVAEALLIDADTLRRYVCKYESGGIDVLLSDNYLPYLGRLSLSELEELSIHLLEHTYRTVEEIAIYIEKTYNETYSISGLTSLLHKLGFVYKKSKRTPGKSDINEQKKFILKYNKVKSELGPEDSIQFLDCTLPNHSSVASYGWIKKAETKTLNATVSRKRLNIHGALNIKDLSITTRYNETINQASSIEMLFDLRKKQPKGRIYIVVDNASYYQKHLFNKYAKELDITTLYLTAYSPNLNLIERVWLFFLKKQIYNKYYSSFHEFESNVKKFFRNFGKHKEELSTLLTENFNVVSL